MGDTRGLVCVHFLAALNVHLGSNKMISKNADSEKLDQDVQQNYNEVTSEMISPSNADLLSQMTSSNEIRDLLILEKITPQKEHESKQAEKIKASC